MNFGTRKERWTSNVPAELFVFGIKQLEDKTSIKGIMLWMEKKQTKMSSAS